MTEPLNPEVAILNAALELPAAQRAAYLNEACAGDVALRQRLEELLHAHEQAERFLERPPAGLDFNRTARVNIPLTEKPGDKIGRYKLLQQIGEGGCGVVYMAEQEEPVRRRVALKVIKLGMNVKPSTRLTQELVAADVRRRTSGEPEPSASSPRRLQELIHLLRGDLDWIVMKCLEKDRARRYETANGLASDIGHHLNCEPVVARPPSRLYEFQRTVRRHKFGFAAAGAVIVVLVLGVLGSTWQAVRQQRVDIQDMDLAAPTDDDQLLAVSEALDKLAVEHKVEAELVKLRYFVGMTNDEAADVLGISPRTAKYYWTHARAWLYNEIRSERQ